MKGVLGMRNSIEKKWFELKERMLLNAINNKPIVLSFGEIETIVKPYSMLKLGNTSCDIEISRTLIPLDNTESVKQISLNIKNLVYGNLEVA